MSFIIQFCLFAVILLSAVILFFDTSVLNFGSQLFNRKDGNALFTWNSFKSQYKVMRQITQSHARYLNNSWYSINTHVFTSYTILMTVILICDVHWDGQFLKCGRGVEDTRILGEVSKVPTSMALYVYDSLLGSLNGICLYRYVFSVHYDDIYTLIYRYIPCRSKLIVVINKYCVTVLYTVS